MTDVSPGLVRMVDEAIAEWLELDAPRDALVDEIVHICKSVHENAERLGRSRGEETALDAVVNGGLTPSGAANWLAAVRDRLKAARGASPV